MMSDREWVRGEIRAALQELVRAAQMRVQHDTDRIEDEASKAVEDCADAALKEREAVWATTRDERVGANKFTVEVEVNSATWGELVGDDPTRAAVVRFLRELTKDALVIRAIT